MALTKDQILANLRPESVGVESIPISTFPAKFHEEPLRSLYCEGTGTVTFKDIYGNEDTWSVADNQTIHCAMTEVVSATASGLHGLR